MGTPHAEPRPVPRQGVAEPIPVNDEAALPPLEPDARVSGTGARIVDQKAYAGNEEARP
jgi:hypothetical protein